MKIESLSLVNFKRFTQLQIKQIPERSKLVLLIGTNGSGKSSVFDAFAFLQKGTRKPLPYDGGSESLNYYRKSKELAAAAEVRLHDGTTILKRDWQIESGHESVHKFIGRSSIRIVSRISNRANPNVLANDEDSPLTFIENDERFTNDVFLYIQSINKALREPIFSGKQADTLKIFQDFIEPFNASMRNIFGDNPQTTIRIAEFEEASPRSPAKLIFEKGNSKINYDFLSHGEKQIVILLLNFIVRQEYYKETVIFIDEMDVHLNTKLQYHAIKEITERWIPENSQLWTASHALGFIDFANDYAQGTALDFDDLDFDKTQTILPSLKNKQELYELAVSKEFLDKVFQRSAIFFAEQTDAPLYNELLLDGILFFDGKDKLGAFYKAKELGKKALIDRDYLTDDEIETLKQTYPFLHFTPYYNIEALYFHPDNLEAYFKSQNKAFDKEQYRNKITDEKEKQLAYISLGIAKARDGYPFFKENGKETHFKNFKNNALAIADMLKSNDFETYYKVFNAKCYGTSIAERQRLGARELTKTDWFKNQIQNALNND